MKKNRIRPEASLRLMTAIVSRCFKRFPRANCGEFKNISENRVNFAYTCPFICEVADALNIHHVKLRKHIIKGNGGKWDREKLKII